MIEPCRVGVENYSPGLRNLLSDLEKDTQSVITNIRGKLRKSNTGSKIKKLEKLTKLL